MAGDSVFKEAKLPPLPMAVGGPTAVTCSHKDPGAQPLLGPPGAGHRSTPAFCRCSESPWGLLSPPPEYRTASTDPSGSQPGSPGHPSSSS